jgi:LysM repeat protein
LCGVLALAACAGNAAQDPVVDDTTVASDAAAPGASGATVASKPPAEVPFYTVVQGDTIGKIATKLGVTAQLIVDANGLANANKISIGQKLRIPAGGRASDGSIVGSAAAVAATPAATATSTTAKK